ncbi:hypothetical protein [Pseudochryseolinea flava]|uniref:Uncharacterized protein n=1 Tax=Pseudochryseolinea flava TaxID=2059302 RepID=A0A364XYW5_9BACT|nr:hypothetical protein [Pseudochryseolinea flava]RAV99651.1 hypothetical protein DQQ10_18820 [Pseudochryseolinea flava]
MELFDNFVRTYNKRANHDHSSYAFLNESIWPAAAYVRRIVSDWSNEFPLEKDFVRRFKSDNHQEHLAAFFEITIHQWLRKQFFDVELHEIASTTSRRRPDFCISKNGNKEFYAECTLSAIPDYEPGIERLKNQITDVLEGIPCPKYWLSVSFEKCNTISLPKKKVISFVQGVIDEGLDHHENSWERKYWTMNERGWSLRFSLFPKSIITERTLGSVSGGPAGIIYSEKPLRASLDRKRGRNYGDFNSPYIICINSADFYLDNLSIMQTLFGSRAGEIEFSNQGSEKEGFFLHDSRQQNTSVSGVLIVKDLVPWNLHVVQASLWHNPFATFPIDKRLLNVRQVFFEPLNEEGKFYQKVIEGKGLGDILEIDPGYMKKDVE